MKKISWQILLGLFLITLSAILYFTHYLLFKDTHHIFIYLLGDIAFVPIEVLLVTLIIHKILNKREKQAIMEKLNMLIGTFFSEIGNELLAAFSDSDPNLNNISKELIVKNNWDNKRFDKVMKSLKSYEYKIDITKIDLIKLKKFLLSKRDFMARLLENPNLLEHEPFTDLLWAAFHVIEELASRGELYNLPENDYKHIEGDIERAYKFLVYRWLNYMKHLRSSYPYLFSLAMRTNPFDAEASAILKN